MPESALLFVSSENAHHRTTDTGRFTINIGNSVYVDKATRIAPVSVSMPNVFTNVNAHNNTWFEDHGGEFGFQIVAGQYTLTELIDALNATGTGITWSELNGHVVMTAGIATSIRGSLEFWELLGFDSTQYDANFNITSFPATAISLPNLGGEKVVFITCDKIAPSNMIHAKDGTPYDVVATISMHDTPYGQVAYYRNNDVELHDIEYKGHNQFDTLIVELWDSKMRPLPFAENQHFYLLFKVFHEDNNWGVKKRKLAH